MYSIYIIHSIDTAVKIIVPSVGTAVLTVSESSEY